MPLEGRPTHFELCATRQHLLEANADALNHREEHGAADGAVPRRAKTTPYCQRPTSQKPRCNGVEGIFLPPYALDCAVKCAEETTPDAEIAAQYRGAHLDCRDGADAPLAVGAIAEALDAVPNRAAYRLRGGSVKLGGGACIGLGSRQRPGRTPMAKAPPKSFRMTQGHGSRV